MAASARRLAKRKQANREAYFQQQIAQYRRKGGSIVGFAPAAPYFYRGIRASAGGLPVLLNPLEPGHVPLPRAAIITGLPIYALNKEAREGRVPGAYLVGSVIHFDLLAMENWIYGFRSRRRPDRRETEASAAMGLSVSDVSRRLGVDDSTVRRMVKRGELQAFKVRRSVRIWDESLEAYTRRTAVQAEHEAAAARHLDARARNKDHENAVRAWEELRRRIEL